MARGYVERAEVGVGDVTWSSVARAEDPDTAEIVVNVLRNH